MNKIFDDIIPFPDEIVPDSMIIYPGINIRKSYRAMYMDLFNKYIDPSSAEWPIQISKENTNRAVELMRRCKVYRATAKSMHGLHISPTQRASSKKLKKNKNGVGGSSKNDANSFYGQHPTPNTPTTQNNNAAEETYEMDLASTFTTRTFRANSTATQRGMKSNKEMEDLREYVETLDAALSNTVKILKETFEKFKNSDVCILCFYIVCIQ